MLVSGAVILLATYVVGHWLAGLSIAVLLLGWRLLATSEGPPVLALAFTYQWMQITIGLFYNHLTGQPLEGIDTTEWERMMVLGLGCISALAVGLSVGLRGGRRVWPLDPDPPQVALSWRTLVIVYGCSIVVVGAVQELAWRVPAFTQAIIGVTFSRLALLFLMTRRLVAAGEWRLLGGLVLMEVALGFTGYFAGFREPLVMVAIATIEAFDRKRAGHWLAVAALMIILGGSGLLWMSVRGVYRQDYDAELFAASRTARLMRIRELSTGWFGQDREQLRDNVTVLVDRLWAVYYPSLAIARVPSVLPHTGGEILRGALLHLVTPRALFPDKPELPSDSDMVRKYSGLWVAGVEQNTSIAFGYAAESYIDFGVPVMFLPSLIWGLFMGAAYQWFIANIKHRELAVGLVTVVFWLALYLFERSWVKTLGMSVTLFVYLGGLTFLIDRWLMIRTSREQAVAGRIEGPMVGRSNP
jgi:hypothetical protein